jgi:hypothetical protein
MIKRQYNKWDAKKECYFHNFLKQYDTDLKREDLKEHLKPYKATLSKTTYQYKINVKWHEDRLYTLFVLRWS